MISLRISGGLIEPDFCRRNSYVRRRESTDNLTRIDDNLPVDGRPLISDWNSGLVTLQLLIRPLTERLKPTKIQGSDQCRSNSPADHPPNLADDD